MKENLNKPLHADYRKEQVLRFFWVTPVISGEKSYRLADIPLVAAGRILIVLAIGVIGWLNPFSRYYSFETAVICFILIFIMTAFYKYKFVYRFGRFRVAWVDAEKHPYEEASSRCDEGGNFLKTEENRIAAKKSRRAFCGLFTGIIAVVLLYCFLWIGLSYLRVYSWHMGEIEEAKRIAQNYDNVHVHDFICVHGDKEGGEDISDQDRRRLWEIFHSLKWGYVSELYINCKDGHIQIDIDTPFGYSKLLWYEDNADISYVKQSFGANIVTQIDEHWFYLKKDDAEFWW